MIGPETPVSEVVKLISGQSIPQHPPGWYKWENVQEAHRIAFEDVRIKCHQMRGKCTDKGRGIIIAAGGRTHFTCAYVAVRTIRERGSKLPIEIWYLGAPELDTRMKELLREAGGDNLFFVDALKVHQNQPARILSGWELKAYSCMMSNLEEILYLDADNIPFVNVDSLFDLPAYKANGAVFWPDFCSWTFNDEQLKVLGITRPPWWITPYRAEDFEESFGRRITPSCDPPLESGQYLLKKSKVEAELALTMWLCYHSDFYFRHFHGDKDMFFIAWQMINRKGTAIGPTPYGIPSWWPTLTSQTIIQYDFTGKPLFFHRVKDKWSTVGRNKYLTKEEIKRWNIPDYVVQGENRCHELVDELRGKWDSSVNGVFPATPIFHDRDQETTNLFKAVAGKYRYNVLPRATSPAAYISDGREVTLHPDGSLERESRRECYWDIQQPSPDSTAVLTIYGLDWMPTCHLTQNVGDRIWRGQWFTHEKCPVELVPSPGEKRVTPQHQPEIKQGSLCFVVPSSEQYFPQFLVLVDSIEKYHGIDADIICASYDLPKQYLDILNERGIINWPLPIYYNALARERPNMVLHALREGYEYVVLLGADTELYSQIPLEILKDFSVALVPHYLQPQPNDGLAPCTQDMARVGIANSDCQLVRNTPDAWKAYHWLSTICEQHCFIDPGIGICNEQHWLSMLPILFDGCTFWKTKQVNVATYNCILYGLRKSDRFITLGNILNIGSNWAVDNKPLVLFHYSGFDPKKPTRLSKFTDRTIVLEGDLKEFFDGYTSRVGKYIKDEQ